MLPYQGEFFSSPFSEFPPHLLGSQLISRYFPLRVLGITCKRALVLSQTELKARLTESLSPLVSKHRLPSRNGPSPITNLCSLRSQALFLCCCPYHTH